MQQELLHPVAAQARGGRQRRRIAQALDVAAPLLECLGFECAAIEREGARVDLLVTAEAMLVAYRGLGARNVVTAVALELLDQLSRRG